MAGSRFYEHFGETSNVHVQPLQPLPSATTKTFYNQKRVLSRVQERSEPMPKRQTSTLNCNGLAFRHTTFVPDPDMVHFTVGPGSKLSAPGDRNGHKRDRTPTTLAALAGFSLLPYAIRKAAMSSREKLEYKERKRQTRESTKLDTGRHDSAVASNPRLATPSLGSTLNINLPQSFESGHNTSSSDTAFEPIYHFHGNESWNRDVEFSSPTMTTSPLSSVCTGEKLETIGTRLSDLAEVSETSEPLPDEFNVPLLSSSGTIMLVRGWSSSSGEEELSPLPPKGRRRTWKEV